MTALTKPVFDQEFPQLQQIVLPAYNITYSKRIPLWLKLLGDSGRIKRIIRQEHELLKSIVSECLVDVVISDNRFGLYHNTAYTVFITHQLSLKTPVFSGQANRVNRRYINRFREVWVPDYESDKICLSGELAHHVKGIYPPLRYIGPQSRLVAEETEAECLYDYLVLLSGPEPQRTILESLLIAKFQHGNRRVMLVRGTNISREIPPTVTCIDFASPAQISAFVKISAQVICRSGYSTLMDMHHLGKKELILVPTPGQTEQEYLAKYWQEKFGARQMLQNNIQHFNL